MRSLTGAALDFYSCFISYSTANQDFAERLHADLQAKGVRCWFAPHDIQGGRKIHEQIDEAIRLYDKLVLILSAYGLKTGFWPLAGDCGDERRRHGSTALSTPLIRDDRPLVETRLSARRSPQSRRSRLQISRRGTIVVVQHAAQTLTP